MLLGGLGSSGGAECRAAVNVYLACFSDHFRSRQSKTKTLIFRHFNAKQLHIIHISLFVFYLLLFLSPLSL